MKLYWGGTRADLILQVELLSMQTALSHPRGESLIIRSLMILHILRVIRKSYTSGLIVVQTVHMLSKPQGKAPAIRLLRSYSASWNFTSPRTILRVL